VRTATTIAACLLIAGGCGKRLKPTVRDDRGFMNTWIVESMNNEAVDNAIVSQRTLYPYHFVSGTPVLNNLGVRDLRVLATHFRRYPGQDLNIRRADADEALYKARVETITTALIAEGVPADAVHIHDGFAGGAGVSSRRASMVLERAEKPTAGPGAGGEGSDMGGSKE
jgi:hypothetical protein